MFDPIHALDWTCRPCSMCRRTLMRFALLGGSLVRSPWNQTLNLAKSTFLRCSVANSSTKSINCSSVSIGDVKGFCLCNLNHFEDMRRKSVVIKACWCTPWFWSELCINIPFLLFLSVYHECVRIILSFIMEL